MRLELTGRHVDITPGLRRLIDTKLTKLDRRLNDRAVSAQCVLTLEKRRRCAEITLHARGEKFLHAVAAAAGWQAAVTAAVAKLVQQAGTVKGKLQERKRQGSVKDELIPATPPAPLGTARRPGRGRTAAPHVVQASRRPIKPMSIADATRQLHAGGDGVVIFRDVETASVNVLYRQANGELRLVETEA